MLKPNVIDTSFHHYYIISLTFRSFKVTNIAIGFTTDASSKTC